MNFFKRLFSSGRQEEPKQDKLSIGSIYTDDYFNKRYTEKDINADPAMLDGCLKMVESYFIDNKLERKVSRPVNHPANLDQTLDEDFGFQLYCNAVNSGDMAAMFLAYAFSGYLIDTYGFKLYSDNEPEYPLRGMTLKYDKKGVVLSLYPYEYATKAMDHLASFEELDNKLKLQLENIPSVDDILKGE